MFKKILHEPLIHFLFFGGLIFLYYGYKTPQQTTMPNTKTISFSSYDITALENKFTKEYDQNLTQILKTAIIHKQFYNDVLLKEAFSLGLEKQDDTIRKKLLSKMDFILSNTAFKEPSQEELKKYYKKHIQDYTEKQQLSFAYIKTDSKEKANQLYKIVPFLQNTDKLTTLHNLSYQEVKQQYGKFFAQQLFQLKKGIWSHPLQTQNGFMIIKVISYDKLGKIQPFDDVEYQVYNDYKNDFMRKNKEKKLQKILKRYRLEIQQND